MRALLKVILIGFKLIQFLIDRREVAKRDEDIKAIRNDPTGSFVNEFGGVSDDASKTGVSRGEARAEVDQDEWRWRHKR